MPAAQHSYTVHCFMHNASEIGIKLKFKIHSHTKLICMFNVNTETGTLTIKLLYVQATVDIKTVYLLNRYPGLGQIR